MRWEVLGEGGWVTDAGRTFGRTWHVRMRGALAFGYEIVIENRVCVRFSEESVWCMIGGRRREAPVCDESILNRRRPLKSAAGAVAVLRREAGEWAGLVTPTQWKRAWESSGVM